MVGFMLFIYKDQKYNQQKRECNEKPNVMANNGLWKNIKRGKKVSKE